MAISISSRGGGRSMRKLLLFLLLILGCRLFPVGILLQPSAYHHALSGLSLLNSHPANSFFHPSLAQSGIESSVSRILNLEQLPLYNTHFAFRTPKYGFFLGSSYLNNNLYTESDTGFGINYTYKFISVGASIHLIHTNIKNFNSHSAYPICLGIAWQQTNITTAFSLRNAFQAKFAGELLPMIFLWETAGKLSDKTTISFGLEKENDFDFSFKMGSSYKLLPTFSLLCSYQYNPHRMGVGVVFSIRNFNICYGVRTHPHLNLSHYITLHYEILH